MINNKRGLSTVVTTLIIILLVLVAIGIIWIVVRGVIETGAKSADYAVKCLQVDVRATAVDCTGDPASCNITLTRKAGGENIGGIKLIFHDSTAGTASGVIDVPGNIPALTTTTETAIGSTLTAPDKVDVTVYFTDESGEDQLCSQTNPFSLS